MHTIWLQIFTLLEDCNHVQEKITIKITTEKHTDDDLEKRESYSDSIDETESDIDNDK